MSKLKLFKVSKPFPGPILNLPETDGYTTDEFLFNLTAGLSFKLLGLVESLSFLSISFFLSLTF